MEFFRILPAVGDRDADLVVNEAFDDVLFLRPHGPAIHGCVIWFGPQIFGICRVTTNFQRLDDVANAAEYLASDLADFIRASTCS